MSGFEVVGIVLGVLPMISAGLKFYEERTRNLRDHEQAMGLLITSLHVEHSRLINSWKKLLLGLVEVEELPGLLEEATEKSWKEVIANTSIETKIRERLGYGYHGYMETMRHLQLSLKQLEGVVGLEENTPWYKKTAYYKWKWHRETWAKLRDFFNHGDHKQLLADIEKCNTRLEQLNPDSELKHAPSRLHMRDRGMIDSIRSSARSLYCALCSSWSCHCEGPHETHFQLQTLSSSLKGSHRFNLMFGLCNPQTDQSSTSNEHWHEVELEVEGENEDVTLSSLAVPAPGRVTFAPSVRSMRPGLAHNPILDICTELRNSTIHLEPKCIGFLVEDRRRHYIHIPKQRPALASAKHTVSLHRLLFNRGVITSPVPFTIELLDKYELAFLLASSLLQLHATSWLEESWSTEDIYFMPTRPQMTLRECAYVTKHFPPTVGHSKDEAFASPQGVRAVVIPNEAIFRLGATLVELSTSATLKSQELESERKHPELSDVQAARRVSEAVKRNNVQQWNQVVGMCLRCGFNAEPDFSKRDFRQEFYQCVVAPLQRLAEDARSD